MTAAFLGSDLTRRRALLTAALAALRVNADEPELALLHRWLDSWTGIGHVATGMARQGYDVHLVRSATAVVNAEFLRLVPDSPWRSGHLVVVTLTELGDALSAVEWAGDSLNRRAVDKFSIDKSPVAV